MNRLRCLILAACGVATLTAETIHLKTRDLEPQADRTEYLAGPLKRRSAGSSHYLVQFDGPVRQEIFRQLRPRGIKVTGSLPPSTFIIAAPDDFALEELPAAWIARLEHRDKISPLINGPYAVCLVEFHSDVDLNEARALVREQGLRLIENHDLAANHLLVSGSFSDLSRLAAWDEVAYIFPASKDLVSRTHVRACGGAVVGEAAVAQIAGSAYIWPVSGPGGLVLGYFFSQVTEKLPVSATQSEILRALNQWAGAANVQFVSGTEARASHTVNILFARGAHGDPFPFDGPGGVLAHTFYPAPPNPEPIAGDMHLDDDERWQIGADTDVYTVALHEAGHALGLVHTDNPDDVMYPYYRLGKRLSSNDIAIVQSLYGAPAIAPAPAPAAAPGLTVQTPPATTTATSVVLSGTVSGGTAPLQIAWKTASGATGIVGGSPSWMANVPLTVGSNAITLTLTDAAGRSSSQTVTITRLQLPPPASPGPNPPPANPPPGSPGDTAPPSLVITYPASTAISTTATALTFKGMATDNVGVTAVVWSSSTGAAGAASGTITWSASVPLSSGTNSIVFKAFDAAGNSAWRSVTVVRQ